MKALHVLLHAIFGQYPITTIMGLSIVLFQLPANGDSVRRPVMIFFHPGGFYGYTGAVYVFGPQYLLDEDIVLVTANYRLGSLGR